jgi:hypothetical protein
MIRDEVPETEIRLTDDLAINADVIHPTGVLVSMAHGCAEPIGARRPAITRLGGPAWQSADGRQTTTQFVAVADRGHRATDW